MRKIPPALLSDILSDPYYRKCARKDDNCQGRITLEHALIYAGRQVNEKWAIIPLCVFHHLRKGLNKRINEAIAVCRMTEEDRKKYPKVDWEQKQKFLENYAKKRETLQSVRNSGTQQAQEGEER